MARISFCFALLGTCLLFCALADDSETMQFPTTCEIRSNDTSIDAIAEWEGALSDKLQAEWKDTAAVSLSRVSSDIIDEDCSDTFSVTCSTLITEISANIPDATDPNYVQFALVNDVQDLVDRFNTLNKNVLSINYLGPFYTSSTLIIDVKESERKLSDAQVAALEDMIMEGLAFDGVELKAASVLWQSCPSCTRRQLEDSPAFNAIYVKLEGLCSTDDCEIDGLDTSAAFETQVSALIGSDVTLTLTSISSEDPDPVRLSPIQTDKVGEEDVASWPVFSALGLCAAVLVVGGLLAGYRVKQKSISPIMDSPVTHAEKVDSTEDEEENQVIAAHSPSPPNQGVTDIVPMASVMDTSSKGQGEGFEASYTAV